MPCWFYDKKDLLNTPSAKDGISAESEAWYRKEGAKHIMDAGNKLGLRFDTCATGVVYFHRFYMFHSFKEFHRLVTSACCLFLAGKVEETPKKCKDIIKTFRSMLNDSQFAHFGEDPKEEVMTLERILLQTIKFDLMVEHPYAYLLKFAKLVKGDKAKIQKMVQMAWTFINDSLCTTLCLQWEPEIVAVAVMYLTSRLNKFDIVDWQGKPLGYRGKWYEFLVDDVTLELLEDICHQVLDLYSNASQPQKDAVGSSPLPVKIRQPQISSDDDQSRTPRTPKSPHGVKRPAPSSVTNIVHSGTSVPVESDLAPAAKERERAITTLAEVQSASLASSVQSAVSIHPVAPVSVPLVAAPVSSAFSVANPYIPSQMYSSSFMSSEGSQSIQTLIGTQVQVTTAPVRDDQGRPGSYAGPPAAGYSQQYGVSQSFTGTLSNQVPIAAGASATHRSEYPNSSSVGAAGNYWATSVTGGGYQGNASSTGSSYGQQSQSYQVYQQGVSESPTRAPYVAGNNQPQYPGSSSQSTSPVYMGHGEGHGRPPAFGAQTGSGGLQQQRYQSAPAQSLPAANPSYQSHPSSGASYQNQAAVGQGFHNQSTSGAPFQNQQGVPNVSYQSHSSGGYQGRALPSTGYATQQPSGGFLQSSQQSFQGRDQGSTSGYQSQLSGYQQSSSNIRSGTSGSQQQGGAPRQGGQNWGYQGHDGYD